MSKIDLKNASEALNKALDDFGQEIGVSEFGTVQSAKDGIVKIKGLSQVGLNEVVEFKDGIIGRVLEFKSNLVTAVLFNNAEMVQEGDKVKRTHTELKVPVGQGILGRVIDPFGNPIDGLGSLEGSVSYAPIEGKAPRLSERKPVSVPLATSTIAVDFMIPIGLGQRELIAGDMQTGKTTLALNAIINQKSRKKPIYCFYVAIGQKTDKTIEVYNVLKEAGAMEYTTIVASSASDSAHTQFIAPYSGCAMAEFFMNKGYDTLIVYDDLWRHAVAYREISRLLGRPAGRDAFPADAFHVHAKLLERSACLKKGGSMTALPIMETQDGDISSYIATSVISITDGQIFLDRRAFDDQQRPAIDIGLSVSRVGSSAQLEATKSVSRGMKSEITQYKELKDFLSFTGTELDATQERLLRKGEYVNALISQEADERYSLQDEILLAIGSHNGIFGRTNGKKLRQVKLEFIQAINKSFKSIADTLYASNSISPEDMDRLREFASTWSA